MLYIKHLKSMPELCLFNCFGAVKTVHAEGNFYTISPKRVTILVGTLISPLKIISEMDGVSSQVNI